MSDVRDSRREIRFRDGDEVVEVGRAFDRHPVLGSKRDFGRDISDGTGDRSTNDSSENR